MYLKGDNIKANTQEIGIDNLIKATVGIMKMNIWIYRNTDIQD